MKLEQPRIQPEGNLAERVGYLERYLFRLVSELQITLEAIERTKDRGGE